MAHEAGKGSKRRPTDEEAYADNYQRIFKNKADSKPNEDMFLFKEKEKWREDEIQTDEEKCLGTLRCRWCKFKQQKPDSVLCESCGKEVSV